MKISNSVKALLLVLVLLVPTYGYSQVMVERSKNKVIISGVPYYLHVVKKGETAYSIARAYGMTVEDLTRENPPAVYGLKEGQTLRIPLSKVDEIKMTEQAPLVIQNHDDSKYIYHVMKAGETIFSLSKYYGVSENEILQSNPGIDINNLSVGAEIAIPRVKFMNDRQNFEVPQEGNYFYHKVLEGETMSSIARLYNIAPRVLRRLNRNMRFPHAGDYVKIPGVHVATKNLEPVTLDTALVAAGDSLAKFKRPEGFTPVTELHGSLNVAVLLPFFLNENAARIEIDSSRIIKGKRIYREIKKQDDWIYPASVGYIEMYNGILLAADTLRTLGLNINLYTYDIKSDTIGVTMLIDQGKLDNMDLIIGPVYSYNLAKVASWAKYRDIPVVSPVTLMNNKVLTGNPTVFMPNSSLEVAQKVLARRISQYPNDNIIFIHTDSTGRDPDEARFKNLIFNELSYRIPYDDVKFKEFLFFSRSMFDTDSINRLSHAMSDKSENLAVIASEDPPVISETLDDIYALSKKYKIRTLGYPVIRDLDNIDQKELFELNMLIYSPYWIDYTRRDVIRFNTEYRNKFLTEPTEMSYAWQGYDIAYYFISGLAIYGKDLLIHPEMHNPDLLQTEYDFERKSPDDGFENQKLFPVRYKKDYDIELVNEGDPFELR
ncbi:MAG TPA: LysM peptidoglycan-binding domain-containing protein [Bacteroidales bacterium]|nr:LysM peptidoglycan-binding domain-containing protein [Bacteroidales bacterium]